MNGLHAAASTPRDDEKQPTAVHATCILLDECGILLIGDSGSGKTSLAMKLIDTHARAGRFARLVADDSTLLRVRSGRIIAAPHPRIAGLYELRGAGLRPVRHESLALVRLVARCQQRPAGRYPEPGSGWTFRGVTVPAVTVGQSDQGCSLVMAAMQDVMMPHSRLIAM